MQTPGNPLADLFASAEAPGWDTPLGKLGDDFDVYEVLRGGMGEVLICGSTSASETTELLSVPIALKTFQRQFFFRPEIRSAFLREVRLWSRLSGVPHIMPVLGFRIIAERPYVLMPAVVEGPRTVRELIERTEPGPERAAIVGAQLAIGLALAAERLPSLVHGDLKPENLMLFSDVVYASDFGLARAAEDGHALASTWAYRAPELWTDPARTSVASDVYAFGMILWELLAGNRPYTAATADGWAEAAAHGPPPVPAGAGLVQGLFTLAAACLAGDPRRRPATFDDVYLSILELAGPSWPSQQGCTSSCSP